MTDFVSCTDCAALTLDDTDEIVKHRQWHADFDKKYRNTRSAAVEARDALSGLREDVRRYGEQLAARPVPVEPDQIRVREMPTDEELGIVRDDDPEDDDESDGGPYGTPTAQASTPLSAAHYFGTPT